VGPSEKLPESHFHVPLSMNVTDMKDMFALGKQDAINAVAMGPSSFTPFPTGTKLKDLVR